MVSRQGVIAPEIARAYTRSIHTVTKEWMQHPDWPESTGRRGHHLEFDKAQVSAWVSEHVRADLSPPIHHRDPDGLLTMREIAEESDLSYNTVRSDFSRGRLGPKGGSDTDMAGTPLWRRGSIARQLAERRRPKRT